MSASREILRSRQSRFFGTLCMALGLLGIAFGLYSITLEDNAHWLDRIMGGAIPALIGGFLTAGGMMIAHRRGGLYSNGTQYVLNGDSESDALAIDISTSTALHTWEFRERFGEIVRPIWVIELVLKSGVRILLGESDDEHGLKHVAHEISQGGAISEPVASEPEAFDKIPIPSLPNSINSCAPNAFRFKVGIGGSLAHTLLVGGPSMTLVGALLMSNVEHNHVFGFLFGPLFLVLGCALAAVPLSAALIQCQFTISEDCLSVEYRLGAYRYGQRQIPRDASAYVRIRQRGLLGAGLEIISDGHVLLAMNGVHSTTRVTPSDLLRVATWITAQLR